MQITLVAEHTLRELSIRFFALIYSVVSYQEIRVNNADKCQRIITLKATYSQMRQSYKINGMSMSMIIYRDTYKGNEYSTECTDNSLNITSGRQGNW